MQVIEIINNSADETNQSELLLCAMIAHEYQLEIICDIYTALVAFRKGIHYVWIKDDDEIVELHDYGSGVADRKTLTGAMMQAYIDNPIGLFKFGDNHRDLESNSIYRYLDARMSLSDSNFVKVIVHKPGRNGYIVDGEIRLSE